MWEHSYFLQYKANRAEYIQGLKNIINLKEVNKRFTNKKANIFKHIFGMII